MIDLIERLKHGAIVAGQAAVDEGTSTLAADLMIEAASALAATQAERDAAIAERDEAREQHNADLQRDHAAIVHWQNTLTEARRVLREVATVTQERGVGLPSDLVVDVRTVLAQEEK